VYDQLNIQTDDWLYNYAIDLTLIQTRDNPNTREQKMTHTIYGIWSNQNLASMELDLVDGVYRLGIALRFDVQNKYLSLLPHHLDVGTHQIAILSSIHCVNSEAVHVIPNPSVHYFSVKTGNETVCWDLK
jgi:hypothetical protein